jgi:hypothetical protein
VVVQARVNEGDTKHGFELIQLDTAYEIKANNILASSFDGELDTPLSRSMRRTTKIRRQRREWN